MSLFDDSEFGQRARQLRLDTLIRLRWLAVSGQTLALAVSEFGFGFHFPLFPCGACLVTAIVLNIWLRGQFPSSLRLGDAPARNILGFDIIQLAALLGLTGGLTNPFSILFLAPIMTAAVSLPWWETIRILALALVCATALNFWYMPLSGPMNSALAPPQLYGIALWIAITVSAIFVAIYGSWVATEARRLASALTATELVLARAQHLTQLDGLAAAAAHELGTPLATVALVVRELANQPRVAVHCADDLHLIEEQISRCRLILGKLSAPTDLGWSPIDDAALGQLIEEIAAPQRLQDVEIDVELHGDGPEPMCKRNPAVIYGLTNIVENAVGFAASKVAIRASWTPRDVQIAISDDGPGFPVQVLAQFGDPYISDRAAARRSEDHPAGGLGLGLFIAKALLERAGAQIKIANARAPGRGARVHIAWPYAAFVQTKRSSQS